MNLRVSGYDLFELYVTNYLIHIQSFVLPCRKAAPSWMSNDSLEETNKPFPLMPVI